MTKFADINNEAIIEIAGKSVASKWTEQKYGLVLTRVFSMEAGLPLVFSCCAEVIPSAVPDRKELARESAVIASSALAELDDIAAYWGSYEGRDSQFFVEGKMSGNDALLLKIDVTQVLSYYDYTITVFATNALKDLACSLVGLVMAHLDPFVTRYRGKR